MYHLNAFNITFFIDPSRVKVLDDEYTAHRVTARPEKEYQ